MTYTKQPGRSVAVLVMSVMKVAALGTPEER